MKLSSILAAILLVFTFSTAMAVDYPDLYLRGDASGSWSVNEQFHFTREGDVYSLSIPSLNGEFKISNANWTINYGASSAAVATISDAIAIDGVQNGQNYIAQNLSDVTIRFTYKGAGITTSILIYANGHEPQIGGGGGGEEVNGISGTLPVLYINVYNEGTTDYNNEIIDRNLNHKNYFAGEYWLDLNGCTWLEELGAKSIGSKEEPLPLEIKARGNFTRKAFAKKPFKLKLAKKQKMLGLSNSKHFAILAHADDNYSYLRNFTGFNLGRRMGLPWTPWQQPVEVVINGDYRGLYFLTESIRVDADRVNITELDDNVSDRNIVSGGYLIELDNYDEENQTQIYEKSCIGGHYMDMLRVTWDTPEIYSDLQQRFIRDQFSAMNDYVGACSDNLWSYMDLDDAARYYLVEEIISHTESYHGSTYMFRDRGEGQKWHFSPLWDCGNAFNGSSNMFFYDNDPFGNTWIPSIRQNSKFNEKVAQTWMWFMTNKYDGIVADIDEYMTHIAAAAKADAKRWQGAQKPDYEAAMPVCDNSNLKPGRDHVVNHLAAKTEWLKQHFGNFSALSVPAPEPARDATEAAALPAYARPAADATKVYFRDSESDPWTEVYAYIFYSENGSIKEPLGAWPGTAMTPVTINGMALWELELDMEIPDDAKIIFNCGRGGNGNQTDNLSYLANSIYNRNGEISGISSVTVDAADAEYFDLQGYRVAQPAAGNIYIRLSNGTATKIRY
ncbi:MAG: CotH kinase family protein [Muribaculaceae bacterium]|nr:CotH kinase family protein [Muribaculaceae bacterium]